MRFSYASRMCGALAAVLLVLAVTLAAPAHANNALSRIAMQHMVDPGGIAGAMAASPDGRIPVIVEFSEPEVEALAMHSAASSVEAAEAADSALTRAVHGAQSAILSRVLEAPGAGELSAAMTSSTLNIKRMDFSPMFAITADAALLERLAADPAVARIHLDQQHEPFLTETLGILGMPAAYAGGATGSNWTVAVIDTGGRRSHEFLRDRIVSAACYSTNNAGLGVTSLCPGGVTQSWHIDSANDCAAGTPGCGHGTHVAGTAAGSIASPAPGNPSSGVARSAGIISINVFSRGPGGLTAFTSDINRGLERVYALRNDYRIAAVNLSLGVRGSPHTSPCDNDPSKPAVDLLRSAGIASIFAAGNDGFSSAISSPACISTAIAVANSTKSDQRAFDSNWSNLIDLVAPGSNILASTVNNDSSYGSMSGTSMAAPHVAGAFTALRSAVPTASIEDILSALRETGTPVSHNGVIRPRINVDRALDRLRGGGGGPTPTTTLLTGPASSTPGQMVTFTATVSSPGGPAPTGTVTFRNSGTTIGTGTLSSGRATFSTASLPVGINRITAVYGGSGTHSGSTSSELVHTVTSGGGGPGPANNLFASAMNIPVPRTVTGSNVGATAEPGEPMAHRLAGSVSSVWWRYTPTSSGQITIDTFGSNFDTVLAVYTGNRVDMLTLVVMNDDTDGLQSRVQFTATAGVSYAIAVAGYGTATGNITLSVSGGGGGGLTSTTSVLTGPLGSVSGETVTFSVTVIPQDGLSGTPSGTVTFRNNGVSIGTRTLASGRTDFATSSLPVGANRITAVYSGSGTHAASTSSTWTHTVSPGDGELTPTTTALSVPGSSAFGEAVTLSATVSSASGTPSGTVSFRRAGMTIGTGRLSSGTASFTTSSLPVGSHAITAVYGGTDSHAGSTSGSRTHVVAQASVTVALTVPSGPVRPGPLLRLSAEVGVVSPGAGTPTGAVRFLLNGATLGSASLSGGRASISAALPVGEHSVVAQYVGSMGFRARDSAARTVVISTAMGPEMVVNQR
ncbi:MAG: Ig-like domain repeat protein, partial [Pararhodobacter sp.]|nr:Ig-like domain repeat protein [Pararhodobacter sp.]